MNPNRRKTVVIVGYGTLGPGVVGPLYKAGFRNFLVTNREADKSADSARDLLTTYGADEIAATGVALDVTKSDMLLPFVSRVQELAPDGVDLVVMAAGGNEKSAFIHKQDAPRPAFPGSPLPAEERAKVLAEFGVWSATAMKDVYNKNVLGPITCLYRLLPTLLDQEVPPVIVTIGSVSPELSGVGHYAASKLALEEETKRLAYHLGWARRSVGLEPGRAICVVWGFTQSEQSKGLLSGPDGKPTFRGAGIMASSPLGRFGTVEELGEIVAFVWRNGYFNSSVLADGGFCDQPVV